MLSQVKLIAEPWDVGDGGYQVGQFPARWTEWNGRYRDTVRSFWARGAGVRELAHATVRVLGSVRRRRAAAVRIDQLRDITRRVHAA